MDKPARLFLCARCRVQVLICSDCDRGNRYCADGCANVARRALQRDAGERYQDSYWGRTKHAWRTRRWRQRRAEQRQSVTHQGSHLAPTDAVLAGPPPIVPATAVTAICIGRRFKNDTERLEKLFDLYTKMMAKPSSAKQAKAAPAKRAARKAAA